MSKAGGITLLERNTRTSAPRVERYDPSLGCLAIRLRDDWVVVAPDGTILAKFGNNEYEARNQAQYINLTNDIRKMYDPINLHLHSQTPDCRKR